MRPRPTSGEQRQGVHDMTLRGTPTAHRRAGNQRSTVASLVDAGIAQRERGGVERVVGAHNFVRPGVRGAQCALPSAAPVPNSCGRAQDDGWSDHGLSWHADRPRSTPARREDDRLLNSIRFVLQAEWRRERWR